MTQHEYIFISASIILGLAITRLLHNAAMLIRAKNSITFHWSSAIWALCIMLYVLQLWWVGWGLRVIEQWQFIDFIILVFGCSCLYGAAEMALSEPGDGALDMLGESQQFGRLSALSMLLYFFVGPYLNIFLYGHPLLPSLIIPSIGILLMIFVISMPSQFKLWSALFLIYSVNILVLTV